MTKLLPLKPVTPSDNQPGTPEELIIRVRGERDLALWFLLDIVAGKMSLGDHDLEILLDFLERLTPGVEATNELLKNRGSRP